MPKTFRKLAPNEFAELVKRADSIRTLYRSQFKNLKLTAEFTLGEGESVAKAFDALPESSKEDLQSAKHYYESLWQLAWKQLYYAHPEFRGHDLKYDAKTGYIKEMVFSNPNPVPLAQK